MFDGINTRMPPLPPLDPSTWLHTPPVQMPWGVPIGEQPAVMRFTGDSASTSASEKPAMPKCHSKRKSWDCEIEYSSPPTKQLITEEKMAENLNCLHISNSYVSHQIGSSQPMSIPLPESPPSAHSTDIASSSDSSSSTLLDTALDGKERTVSLCEQLRKLISDTSVMSSPIINKVERPSNALVLWRPPGGSILENVVKSSSNEEGKKENKQGQNIDPKLRTTEVNFPLPSTSQSRWDDLMDNNNSSNAMDLNLYPASLSSSSVLPSDVPLPDDDFMDLPEESMMDY